MHCKHCLNENTKVIFTNVILLHDQPVVSRKRRCVNCKKTFNTVEYPEESSVPDPLPIRKEGAARTRAGAQRMEGPSG